MVDKGVRVGTGAATVGLGALQKRFRMQSENLNVEVKVNKEGRWEKYSKYIKLNYFSYFLSMQCTNGCHLAMVAFKDYQKAMVAR